MKFIEKIKMQVIVVILLEIIALVMLLFLGLTSTVGLLAGFLFINVILIAWIVYTIEMSKQQQDIDISRVLGNEAKDAFDFGKVGIVTYDENYIVTWQNDFLGNRGLALVGNKVTTLFEDVSLLFQGEVDVVRGSNGKYIYEVARKENGSVLFIKDVTRLATISEQYKEEAVVFGIIHLDNYMDISSFEDEAKIANINSHFRQPIVEWASHYGMMIRRLRSDRFIVVLNEKIYKQVLEDKFTILNETRKTASELDVSITLSMAFARGSNDLDELDDMVNNLIELAQSRGGDQVAVKFYGEDVKYYGGNSEATSKRSRVRVRVMAQALKEAILESNQVFISGHKDMDFDCMGANLALSRIVQAYGKTAYIVSKSGGVESYLQETMSIYGEHLETRHQFISDEEACKLRKEDDLLIVVDYHNPLHSNAPMLLEKLERVAVIDHHRRTENYIHKPLLVYIESGASSSCELITEFLEYIISDIDINDVEAMIMYLGILVDTNRFKMRTGFRTFEAAAQLKKLGVDPILAEDLLKESFDDFEAKINIYKYCEIYADNLVVACVDENSVLSRNIMSMSADSLLAIKNMEASFVIARTGEHEVSISCRSKGNINVQRIMEEMHGGGHFSAAAVQIKDKTPMEVKEILMNQIDLYLKEDESNESDLT